MTAEDQYIHEMRQEKMTPSEAGEQYAEWQRGRQWADNEEYTTWLDIGWGPFELQFFGSGGQMWTFHMGGRSGAWNAATVANPKETPFNGESDIFTKMHEGDFE